jgi:phage tail-like protein
MAADPYFADHKELEDPLPGFAFLLDLGDGAKGYFQECGGIGSEHEIIEIKSVDSKGHEVVIKQPGRLKWGDVTLKRGITNKLTMWEWREKVVKGLVKDARKNCSITMLDRGYNPVATWHFDNAWPSKLTGPSLKADGNDFGIEELTLVHEGMYREK